MKRIGINYIAKKIFTESKIIFQVPLEISKSIDLGVMLKILFACKKVNELCTGIRDITEI